MPQYKTLAETWDVHISGAMDGRPMQSEEYRAKQEDYLAGAMDVLTVYYNILGDAAQTAHVRVTALLMTTVFQRLMGDTLEQYDNLLALKSRSDNNALSDNVVDDEPQPFKHDS